MKRILLLLCIPILCFTAKGQDSTSTIAFSFEPSFLLINGIKLNIEKSFRDSRHAILVSPQLYNGTRTYSDWQRTNATRNGDDRINGWGIEGLHKIYLNKSKGAKSGYYIGHGFMYRNQQINFPVADWMLVKQGDIEVYQYTEKDWSLNVSQYGYHLLLGTNIYWQPQLYVDVYTGIGIRFANVVQHTDANSAPLQLQTLYNNYPGDYGFAGNTFVIGLRIGGSFF